MPNVIEFLILIRPYAKLLVSWRFVFLSLSTFLSLVFVFFVLKDVFSFSSISLFIYIVWLVVFVLSLLYAFCQTPTEDKLYKEINSELKDLNTIKAAELVQQISQFYFISPRAQLMLGLAEAKVHKEQGELVKVYEKLQDLKRLPLLPSERLDVDLEFAITLFESGNYKTTNKMLEGFSKQKLKGSHLFNVTLLKSKLYIENGEMQAAKDLLETRLSDADLTDTMKVGFFHDLAVCEKHQKNHQNAASYYRQSWGIQKHRAGHFAQAEITIDNLIFCYAQQGKSAEIPILLKELKKLANPNNVAHFLAINNIKVNYARQLGIRQDLISVYENTKQNLLPKLKDELKFNYLISQLRMSWNDQIDFEIVLKQSMEAMLHRPPLSALGTLRGLKEVTGTVIQAQQKLNTRPDLVMYYCWLVMEWQRLEPEIEHELDMIPPVLLGPRDEMLRFKLESIKYSFIFRKDEPKVVFDELFQLLNEQKNIWSGMHNTRGQLEALMLTLNEYIVLNQQLNNPVFPQNYKTVALKALEEAKTLLNQCKGNLTYAEYFVRIAYCYYQLGTNKSQAKTWLDTFDNTRQSLNHYASWLREQYEQTKIWVNQV